MGAHTSTSPPPSRRTELASWPGIARCRLGTNSSITCLSTSAAQTVGARWVAQRVPWSSAHGASENPCAQPSTARGRCNSRTRTRARGQLGTRDRRGHGGMVGRVRRRHGRHRAARLVSRGITRTSTPTVSPSGASEGGEAGRSQEPTRTRRRFWVD